MYKIALLAYPFTFRHFEETIVPFRNQCQIDLIPFEKQYHLLELIPSLVDQYDGFFVSNDLAERFLRQANPAIQKPIVYLDRNSVNYFKTFFLTLNEIRNINLSRVVIDTSMCFRENVRSLDDLVKNIAYFEENRLGYSTELSMEDFISMEAKIEKNACELWRQGKFDVIVCRFASVAAVMEKEDIPYEFVWPERYRITEAMNTLLNRIHMDKQLAGLPASIMVLPNDDKHREFQEINHDSVRIQKALLEFGKHYSSNFMIQYLAQGYEILTSHMTIQKITGNFTGCQLGHYLFSTQGINVRIGYGVGHDISSARQNALLARKATEDTGTSCVVTEEGLVIPLQVRPAAQETPAQNDSAVTAADKSGLSPVTIKRIRSALHFLGTNETTNHDLAEALQVTVANANRFLNALVANGFAEITGIRKSTFKGRPSRIYRIDL
jgi:hypothetical protein